MQRDMDHAIKDEWSQSVATLIGELISATVDIRIPLLEYWPTIREICDSYDAILICDEVNSDFAKGR